MDAIEKMKLSKSKHRAFTLDDMEHAILLGDCDEGNTGDTSSENEYESDAAMLCDEVFGTNIALEHELANGAFMHGTFPVFLQSDIRGSSGNNQPTGVGY